MIKTYHHVFFVLMTDASRGRYRASSNPRVSEDDYVAILEAWLQTSPAATFSSLLGPYISLERESTPTSLIRASDLLKLFVKKGCDQCVLLGARLETAICRVLSTRPNLAGKEPMKEAHLVANHVIAVCSMVRNMKREEDSPGRFRRYPKTSHIRRKMSTSDWIVLRPLLNGIKLITVDESACTSAAVVSPASTVKYGDDASMGGSSALSAPSLTDDEGWPTFKKFDSTAVLAPEFAIVPSTCHEQGKPLTMVDWGCLDSDLLAKDDDDYLLDMPLDKLEQKLPEAVDEPIATPKYKQRKCKALEAKSMRKHAALKPDKEVAVTNKIRNKIDKIAANTADVVEVDDLAFDKVFSTCTTEKNPRFQVTARVIDSAGKAHRVHVGTLSKMGYGESFASKGKQLVEFCEKGKTLRQGRAYKEAMTGTT